MSAVISPCGLYRYRLERDGPGEGSTAVIMVNPSTADATQDDATIRKLLGFGRVNSWGRIIVGNLFAYRATDVGMLGKVPDPFGPYNLTHLSDIMHEADRIIVAWGRASKLPKLLRRHFGVVIDIAAPLGLPLYSIGAPAKDGHPCHPLMLPYNREIQPWSRP